MPPDIFADPMQLTLNKGKAAAISQINQVNIRKNKKSKKVQQTLL